ncbi:MAG: hypothetical protein CMM87_02520 [Rickettsiales bacterium]|nr:hypothetical protein [Rickettsiales bacterium]|tara:strand:+ start:18424 stop:18984 length:561 start_codon:yes stop_codon:yes gene_type:complete
MHSIFIKLSPLIAILTITQCTQNATSELSNLQGLAGQYRSLSTTVRSITNNANSVQQAQMISNNLINSLNMLNVSLPNITSWETGRRIFQGLLEVTNVLAQPKTKASVYGLTTNYPDVNAVRAQIATIQAFVNGMTNQLETMTPDKLDEYNTRLQNANQLVNNILTYRGSGINRNALNTAAAGQLS